MFGYFIAGLIGVALGAGLLTAIVVGYVTWLRRLLDREYGDDAG
jgi:hypothetical protein